MVPFLYASVVYVVGRMLWYKSQCVRPWYILTIIGAAQSALIFAALKTSILSVAITSAAMIGLALSATIETNLQQRDRLRFAIRVCALVSGLVLLAYVAGQGRASVRPEFASAAGWIGPKFAYGNMLTNASWAVVWSRALG